jgi:putative membrane protein
MTHFDYSKKTFLQVVLTTISLFSISSFSYIEGSTQDQQFVDKAAQISLEEIKLGELAQLKSTKSEVKELGKMMEEGHRQSLNDLTVLAKKKSMTIPTTLASNANEAYKNLKSNSEANFDKVYCDMMINGHKSAIALFEKASKDSNDADIREWATNTLPILRMHLDHAVSCKMKCEKM